MDEEVNLRIKGKLDSIKEFLNYLEKENILANQSDFREDDSKVDGYLVFVTAVPKRVVE